MTNVAKIDKYKLFYTTAGDLDCINLETGELVWYKEQTIDEKLFNNLIENHAKELKKLKIKIRL